MNNRLLRGQPPYDITADSSACSGVRPGLRHPHRDGPRDGPRACFAFVTMETNDAANAAVSNLNGVLPRGPPLRVNVAEPRGERSGGGGGGNARGGHRGW